MVDRFSNWVRTLFDVALHTLARALAISAIAFLAGFMLCDLIQAAKDCQTWNVFSNCVENNLRNL